MMKHTKKIIAAGALTIGIGTGAAFSSPKGIDAASNVVLASVDWVTSQLNPVKSKVSELETKLNAQQQEINALKAQLAQTGTPVTPPPATQPPASGLPSAVYANKSSVNIHSGATRDYKIIAVKTSGSSLKVIDSFTSSSGLWYRVELSASVKGWVHSSDVSTQKPSSSVPSQVVTTGEVNLRKGATTSYSVIQLLPKGAVVNYISAFTNAKGEKWYNVETSAGVKGWIIATHGEVR
ncbi:SH3 domain-containing protein [Bacillus infantis]|uniref:SH3 domain-containing protein n=2 Tax=Bacillaceae TaxID=186817 RepID=UPI0029645332|nr:SH3 domain-containing protein [Bacillus infantis]MDW2876630.1 SH3 domain-containing protein [Bacillus infantis]